MSTTIDSRVVEMRFDNKQFESNVATTMSTLDKLKQKLHLDGATKGLENVNAASKKVNMTGLGGAVESVSAKFSALEVMGVTALANITNSAVNAGKRMISALTIDPVKTGLSEYETKMNAIQVIQANTREKNTMEDITKALDELNTYADKTIYNFAQMTSNMGKFTAQGHDVYAAANAVKGLANLAAASGASAEDMARATYQMSQAMGGYIKLMDWNSLRNANMATQDLKNTLIALAKVHGVAIDDMIKKQGTFEQTLSEEWLTGDMFTEAMNIYSGVYSEAELKAKGFTDAQVKNFQDLAATAESAATEVKTFTQLWDVLKETAQSGWTQTWELLVGDFATAKEMLTNVQNYFGDIINGWSDIRNTLLSGALKLESPWASITEKFENSGLGKIAKTAEDIEKATDKLKKFQDVVTEVWQGDYKNVDTGRFENLEAAGYDHRVVQELVNKGYQYKLTVEDIEEAHKKFGLTMEDAAEATKETTKSFDNLSDEELKNAGLTEGEIRLYKALAAEAERTGVSIGELVDEMSKNDGRTMAIDSIKNAWSGFVTILTAVRDAWENIFPPLTSVQLYGAIKAVNQFSEHLKVNDETAKNLRRTFEGLFAIVDIITTIIGGGFKIAFKVAKQLIGYFNIDILSVTASIGDVLVRFRDWIDSTLDLTKVLDKIVPPIKAAIKKFKDWIQVLKRSENLPQDIAKGIANGFGKAFSSVKSVCKQLVAYVKSGFTQIPEFLNTGLAKGIKNGFKVVGDVLIELGKMILEKIKNVLGIHSPSKEFFEIGKNITQGLINGIKAGASGVWDVIKHVGLKCIDALKKIDFGTLFAGVMVAGGLATVAKLADAISSLTSPLAGLGDMLEEFGDAAKSISKGVKNFLNAQALLSMAIAIGILALSLSKLSEISPGRLWATMGALVVLAGIIVALTFVTSKINATDVTGVSIKGVLSLIAIAAALLVLSIALSKLADIDSSNVKKTLILFGVLLVSLLSVAKLGSGAAMIKMGGTLLAMSAALLILTGVIALLGTMDNATIKKGIKVIAAFGIFVVALMGVAALAKGNVSVKLGGTLLGFSIALLILTAVIKQIDGIDEGAIKRGIKVIAGFEAMFLALVLATSIVGGKVAIKMGGTLLSLSIALLAMVGIIKLISYIDDAGVNRGLKVIAALEVLFAALILASSVAGKNAIKAGIMLIAMSAALLILSGVLFVLTLLDPSGLKQALSVVVVLELLFIGLVAVSKLAQGSMGSIIALTIALTIVAAAVIALSFVDSSALTSATFAISGILAAFSLMVAAMGTIKSAKSMWGALIPMIAMLGSLTAVIWILSNIEIDSALEKAGALSVLMIALSTALVIVSKAGAVSASAIIALTSMSAAAALAGLILAMMSALDTDNAINNAIGLSILINALATAMLIVNKAGPVSASAIIGLTAMNAAAALAGLILAMMSALEVDNAISNAVALSTLLLSMSTALAIVSLVGVTGPAALTGMGLLAAFIAGTAVLVGGIGALVNEFPQLETFVDKGIPILEKLGKGIGLFAGNIVGGLLEGITDGLPGIADNLSSFGKKLTPFVDNVKGIDAKSVEGVKSLASIVLTLTAANVLDGLTSWLTGGNSLEKFGKELSKFGPYVKKYADSVDGVDATKIEASANAAKALANVAKAIPNSGGMASWFAGENDLSDFGEQLVPFGKSLVKYANSVSDLSNDSVAKINASVDATKALSNVAKELPNTGGVAGWFAGNNDMDVFGKSLASYGASLIIYASSVSGLTDESVDQIYASVDATKALAEMASVLPNTGGVAGWFAGNNDMDVFGTALSSYGRSLARYAFSVAGLSEDSITQIYASVDATKALAEMAKVLPNVGGVGSWFAGDNDMGAFGTSLSSYGASLMAYANSISGLNEDVIAKIHASAAATQALADIANMLPNSGGVGSWFAGDNNLDDFGKKLVTFGTSLVDYANSVSGLNVDSINISVSAANDIIKMAASVSNSIMSTTDGTSLGSFGRNLKSFGKSLFEYSQSVNGLNTTAIDSANTAMTGVADMAASMVGTDFSGMSSLSTNLKTVSTSLGSYAKLNADQISNVTSEVQSLANVASDIAETDFSGFSNLSESLGDLGKSGMNSFMSSFDGASEKVSDIGGKIMQALINAIKSKYDQFVDEGKAIISKFVNGINADKSDATDAVKSMVKSASDAPDDYYESFKSAGSYMVSGFVNGIRTNIKAAASAAAAMAKAALDAAKAELDEHSPSKAFYKVGDYAGLGFINALGDYSGASYDAGASIADSARTGLSNAIRKLNAVINSDMDAQPTIRPVLDLSNVRSGVDTIGDMLSMGTSMGVLSTVGSISSSMNRRVQNGDNSDIISAINKLRKDISNMKGETYNFGDITYDDGSGLNDAVKTLIRAAKVERRT